MSTRDKRDKRKVKFIEVIENEWVNLKEIQSIGLNLDTGQGSAVRLRDGRVIRTEKTVEELMTAVRET